MLNCVEAAALLQNWDHVLVLSHASPDGDTLGSAAALLRGLSSLGKQVSFCCSDEVPEKFSYLFAGLLLEDPACAQHVMTVDVADAALLGGLKEQYAGKIELAVDHHGTHKPFAERRWVEPDSAAAAELIWLLLQELGVTLTPVMASCIYTGLATDTGCFLYRSTTPRTHLIAAETMRAGANAGEINQKLFESKSRAQVAAEQLVLSNMEYFCGGKCALIQLPRSVYEQTGASESDLEGVASLPRQIEGVLLGVTMKEREDGTIKASLRAAPPADAAALCKKFGGGGHTGAAGCSFEGLSMGEAAEKMKAACEAYLRETGLL